MRTELLKLLDRNGNLSSAKLIKFEKTELCEMLSSATSWLNGGATISEKIYCFINDIKEYPDHKACLCCGKIIEPVFVRYKVGYKLSDYCSLKCTMSHDVSIKDRTRKTMLNRYGKDRTSIIETTKKNNIAKYGVEYTTQLESVKDKIKHTLLDKYGVDNISKLDSIKERKRGRCGSGEKTKEFHDSRRKTDPIYVKLNDKEWMTNEYKTKTIIQIGEDLNVGYSTVNNYLIRHGILRENWRNRSSFEEEILTFCKSFGFNCVSNDRKLLNGNEIDILIPEKNLAIEFNGLFWHSVNTQENDDSDNRNKHQNKNKQCEIKNYKLLQINEDDWLNKKEIWKSVIKYNLNIIDRKLNARDCKIAHIDSESGKNFVDSNHLQGSVIGGEYFGSFINGELVSVFQISKTRYTKNADFEILRFCSLLNTCVRGMFSKFLKNIPYKGTIVSYANYRWSGGDVYEKAGFKFSHLSEPGYGYIKDKKVESRVKFQKHKLKSMFENYDDNKTESEMMFSNGYRKIYDCGHKVYTINI